MASPQKENGHTSIANELLEAWIHAGLNGSELAVLLAVVRKTYGWQKKTDAISISQLVRITGKTRRNVMRAIGTLTEQNLLKRQKDKGLTNILGPNKDWESWGTSTKNVTSTKTVTSDKNGTGTSDKNGTGTSTKNVTHKRKSKEREINVNKLTRAKPSPPKEIMNQNIDHTFPRKRLHGDETVNWFLDYWEFKMGRLLGGSEIWNRRYVAHAKRKVGAKKLREIIEWLADPACWWHTKLNQMQNLYKNLDTLVVQMEEKANNLTVIEVESQ